MEQRKLLRKYTKSIQVLQYFKNIQQDALIKDVREIPEIFHLDHFQNYYVHSALKKENPNVEISISDHAFARWNERVSTESNITELTNKLNYLNQSLSRIDFATPSVGVIDNDIVFTYVQLDLSVIVTTFYGRISQKHVLANFENLQHFNMIEDDSVDLQLNDELLDKLVTLPLPAQRMIFKGSQARYVLDEFRDVHRSLFILTVESSTKKQLKFFYSDRLQNVELEHSVRKALTIMGHEALVFKQIEEQYSLTH
ncbi:hypothetical protein PaeCFBP13512_22240 [Paenibacillus sp. CFBP13512]|uniref:hypothetical protein n=1 Tax=Paenibacillus sp. CFBP13512 TaxID=2184007 RepID=UPI0010C0D055|nr:hypothetical protein [Paenibacillus sp. CFBP13512]TKJ83843.1 hypothetical protein PaeCFBP13512_22240 [Paenibacillus sp. CFBP13512]